ncbi:MAG: lipopolysaccharide core heptose(I) kinase RfaP [Gammaproteobacteria bacterium]|nr:lipopolysaccharide core heptose(I) kinase RfaP [Gammaproteobacteria bacterium]
MSLITVLPLKKQKNASVKLTPDLLSYWTTLPLFDQIMQTEGMVYRQIEQRVTLKFTHNDANFFIKKHHGAAWTDIVKNIFSGRPAILGAKNEYIILKRLAELDIKAPIVAGFGASGLNPLNRRSFVITHEIPSAVGMDTLATQWKSNQLSWRTKQNLIKKIAEITRALHQNGVNHRDLYACHFMITQPLTENPDVTIMDLHRAGLRKKTPLRWIRKDLASLYYSILNFGVTQRDILRFMAYYANKPWVDELKDRSEYWFAVKKKAKHFIRRHHKFFDTPL